MSLQVWLPLNGNSKNQGTKQYTEVINTLEYADNGKVTNKCASFGELRYNKNPLGMIGSICFWIYPKSADEGYNGGSHIIFGNEDIPSSKRKWSLFLYPDNTSLHSWGCQKDDGSNTDSGNGAFGLNGVLKESTWNHVCVAHDLDYEYVYINGILKSKIKWDSNGTFTFDIDTPIIDDYHNSGGSSIYKLNDFRIYDNCLTQSEVSEIAKGLMLHYTFENPYVTETTNIPHSIVTLDNSTGEVTLGSDSTGKYMNKTNMTRWSGIGASNALVKPGRYYTWSMEVMPTKNTEYVIDGNVMCNNSSHAGSNDMHFNIIRGYSHLGHEVDGSDTLPKGKLEAYKWTKIYFTIKVRQDCTNPYIFHTFVPFIPSGSSEVKVYYKNSQLEEKIYDTPYTSSNRKAGLIRDNSGMGNDGTQVYQREEILITYKAESYSLKNVYDSNLKTYTINGFSGIENETCNLGTISYINKYHHLGSKICYEFDVKLQDITVTDGKTIKIMQQGDTVFKDGTYKWIPSPVHLTNITSMLNNGATGSYHICIERTIDNSECVTNVDNYRFGLRFDYVKSGTVTVSNLHSYYGDLDTSTLSLVSDSPVGNHSAYFNGKNFIKIPDISLPLGDLTVSFWGKYNTNNIAPWGRFINLSKSTEGSERLIIATVDNNLNFHYYGTSTNGTSIVTPLNKEGWHLYTLVINNSSTSKMSLYIDGEFETDTTINTKHTGVLMKENYIGKSSYAADSNLCGYIDDVRLYATALSSKDIKALYNVKTKIDNKSNLYCNQLIETKSKNMMKSLSEIIPNNDVSRYYSNGTFSYKDGILKYTISEIVGNEHHGFFIRNSCYGGELIDNKRYKYSFWVRTSKESTWSLGEEKVGTVDGKSLEPGKWYYIEKEGTATQVNKNFRVYGSGNFVPGDTIEVRDIQIYRLYDDENYNSGPNIKGQYRTFELNETFNEDVENSGATIVDKYGAEWLEVFHHNTNGDTVWFANESEALHTNSQYKFSILDQLENFRDNNGKFEFLLEYPQDLPGQYNRWKQTDNPTKVTEVVNDKSSPANGYEAIHIDWLGNYWGGLLRSSTDKTYIDGSVGHSIWFYAIGCYNNTNDGSWSNHLPGTNGSPANEVNLYVRIDNLPNKNKIFRQYKRQTKTKEIIEI